MYSRLKKWFLWPLRLKSGFSVICIYNNRQKLEKYLIQSLNGQTAPYELLAIDNTGDNYKSAPEILNKTARKARYEYLMFVHQDVSLNSSTWLAAVYNDLKTLPLLGAAGVAGNGENGFAASVTHGNPPHLAGPTQPEKALEVQTLDGCLMIVPRKIFEKVKFDETTIKNFYLYVVDYCLDLIRLGYRIYVLPHHIYHESTGPSDTTLYKDSINSIVSKHKIYFNTIYTTMGEWKTSNLH